MKKLLFLLGITVLCTTLSAEIPWENSIIVINNTGGKIVRISATDRLTQRLLFDSDIELEAGASIQMDIEGSGEAGLDLVAYDQQENPYRAWDIDPKKDSFILLEASPTYYSAPSIGNSDYLDIVKLFADTIWVQIKEKDGELLVDPDTVITFSYTKSGWLGLTASFISNNLLITDAEYNRETNTIILYTENESDSENPVQLLDIYIGFNDLPEGLAAFAFGESDSFIFAPYNLLLEE